MKSDFAYPRFFIMHLLLFALLLQLPLVFCRVLQPTFLRQEITVPGELAAEGYVLFATVDKMRCSRCYSHYSKL